MNDAKRIAIISAVTATLGFAALVALYTAFRP